MALGTREEEDVRARVTFEIPLAKVVEQGMSRDELDEKLASLSATPVGTPRLTSP